jgi:hypothetical protein
MTKLRLGIAVLVALVVAITLAVLAFVGATEVLPTPGPGNEWIVTDPRQPLYFRLGLASVGPLALGLGALAALAHRRWLGSLSNLQLFAHLFAPLVAAALGLLRRRLMLEALLAAPNDFGIPLQADLASVGLTSAAIQWASVSAFVQLVALALWRRGR